MYTSALLADALDIVGGALIYEIVEPVVKEEICVRSPGVFRLLCRVVIGEVMAGDLGIKTAFKVAFVLKIQCLGIVFAVTRYIKESALFGSYDVDTCLVGFSKDIELTRSLDILTAHLGMAGMGSGKLLIEAAKEGMTGNEVMVLENA